MFVVLGLGSSIADRIYHIKKGENLILQSGMRIVKSSKIIKTSAWGYISSPFYLNKILIVETSFLPYDLLNTLKSIERKVGREKGHMQPRELDIDIIYYGRTVINTPVLTVPHPMIRFRSFVLLPLVEIMPYFVHPVYNKTNATLYREFLSMPTIAKVNTGIGNFYVAFQKDSIIKSSFKTIEGNMDYNRYIYSIVRRLESYFNGKSDDFLDVRLDFKGLTEAQKIVYNTLRTKVLFGCTINYSELARISGMPGASRFIGNLMAKNPFPVFVPCHRVIKKNGKIGGFSSGIKYKKMLLELEGHKFR